jgi:hypothetical protein
VKKVNAKFNACISTYAHLLNNIPEKKVSFLRMTLT